jgi:CubicO group peptidase (beta-lactamase class C family)
VLAGTVALQQQAAPAQIAETQTLVLSLFERYLESLRQQAGIPGLSAVVVQDGDIVWDRAFGYRDLDSADPAHGDTPYPIADLTQTFAAVLLMECVERGARLLDDPLSRWTPGAGSDTVRQTLAHATNPNGTGFQYDPARFARLTAPVDACGGESARLRVAKNVFERFAMYDSVPGRDLEDPASAARAVFDAAQLERYTRVLSRLAVPYKVDRRGRATKSDYPPGRIDAATGLVSTARDLARYDAALDPGSLLRDDSLNMMWSNQASTGATRPTGLGWFVQTYESQRLVWHFGYIPDAYSSLILKVPAKRLTLILLANSDGLSATFDLARGDVTSSLFALTFLRLFL